MNEIKEDEYLTREKTLDLFSEARGDAIMNYGSSTHVHLEDIIDYLLEMNGDPDTIDEIRYVQAD